MLVSRLRSIIAAAGLNCCVRNENRCFPSAMGTDSQTPLGASKTMSMRCISEDIKNKLTCVGIHKLLVKACRRPEGRFHDLSHRNVKIMNHKKAMGLLVRFSSIHCCTSTLRLSNRSSFCVLIGKSYLEISFALNMLSALIYSELSYSTMQQVATIDTPEVRPPRSSRTRGRFSQIS